MGSYLDISQYECGPQFLAGPLLAYHTSGTVAERAGNDDDEASPHGAWPCRERGWLALSCWSAAEFERLCGVIGKPDLSREPTLETVGGRRMAAGRIGQAIAEWSERQDAHAAAGLLQRVAVHAHAVNTVAELFTDEQLQARALWRRRTHAVLGDQAYCFPAFELSETPGEITAAAPLLGEHNERVFVDLLGLDPSEYESLRALGAMG